MSDSRRTERQTYRLTACQTHFLLFFLTTPDAPEVQFLELIQAGRPIEQWPHPLHSCFPDSLHLSLVHTIPEVECMDTARIFQTGRSQAVRLPKSYRFAGQEVIVRHFGAGVLLLPLDRPWDMLEAGLNEFEPDFILNREQPTDQERTPITVQ